MPRYRRNFVPGASYFITATLADRRRRCLTEHIGRLREAFRAIRARHPFGIDAAVILPEHFHLIITLPPDDHDYPMRLRLIKAHFSRALPTIEARTPSRLARGERGIWQRRYWEHTLRDDQDFQRHIDYIHYNPVKHGLVQRVRDWPHSSFQRYVQAGLLPIDWGGGGELVGEFGE